MGNRAILRARPASSSIFCASVDTCTRTSCVSFFAVCTAVQQQHTATCLVGRRKLGFEPLRQVTRKCRPCQDLLAHPTPLCRAANGTLSSQVMIALQHFVL